MLNELAIDLTGSANLTPRPVVYAGVSFRSTLEARYALFFDLLGLTWVYEPRLWKLEPLWYLPDFFFPSLGVWGEVKPRRLNQDERVKAKGLVAASGQPIVLLVGMPDLAYTLYKPGGVRGRFRFPGNAVKTRAWAALAGTYRFS